MGDRRLGAIERLEVRAALCDLVTRYCMAVDDRDLDTVVSLFLPDGSFGHNRSDPVVGHASIRSHYHDRLSDVPYSIHVADSQLITEIDVDRAIGVVNAHAEMGRPGLPPLKGAMRYHDVYRNDGETWRFESRRLFFWYMAPTDAIEAGLPISARVQWPGEPRAADLPDSLATFAAFKTEIAQKGSI